MPFQDGTAYSLCRDFHEGRCIRRSCRFSHSIVDTVRFKRLVGDLSDVPANHTSPLLVMKCTKSGTTGRGFWEVKLLGGGRATLDNYGWNIDVQPQYPMQSTSFHLGEALAKLELQLFGQRYPVFWESGEPGGTVCTASAQGGCTRLRCPYNHECLDTRKADKLLSNVRPNVACICSYIEMSCWLSPSGTDIFWKVAHGPVKTNSANLASAVFALEQRAVQQNCRCSCCNRSHSSPLSARVVVERSIPAAPPARTSREPPPSYADALSAPAMPPSYERNSETMRPPLIPEPAQWGIPATSRPPNHSIPCEHTLRRAPQAVRFSDTNDRAERHTPIAISPTIQRVSNYSSIQHVVVSPAPGAPVSSCAHVWHPSYRQTTTQPLLPRPVTTPREDLSPTYVRGLLYVLLLVLVVLAGESLLGDFEYRDLETKF